MCVCVGVRPIMSRMMVLVSSIWFRIRVTISLRVGSWAEMDPIALRCLLLVLKVVVLYSGQGRAVVW